MRYWDSSATVPLLVGQALSPQRRRHYRADAQLVAWWGTAASAPRPSLGSIETVVCHAPPRALPLAEWSYCQGATPKRGWPRSGGCRTLWRFRTPR